MTDYPDERSYQCAVCGLSYCKDEIAYAFDALTCMCEGCNGADNPHLGLVDEPEFQRRYEDVL